MAKVKTNSSSHTKRTNGKVSRPGIHSKTKTSSNKKSKNYRKGYRGQG